MKQTKWQKARGVYVGMDFASRKYDDGASRSDYSVVTVYKYPGFIRRFLRRIGLDKSYWSYKIISQKRIDT